MTERSQTLIAAIGTLLLDDDEVRDQDFEGLSLVVQAEGDGTMAMSGYLFGDGRPVPFAPESNFDELELAFVDLQTSLSEMSPDGDRFKSLLVQIKRPELSIELGVEYDDVNRWQVTPANLATLVEQLRP